MAYGKNTKPLIVGFPLKTKQGIERIAAERGISEAEVVRRICSYYIDNQLDLEKALNPDSRPYPENIERRGNNCDPFRYVGR